MDKVVILRKEWIDMTILCVDDNFRMGRDNFAYFIPSGTMSGRGTFHSWDDISMILPGFPNFICMFEKQPLLFVRSNAEGPLPQDDL